jgi:hypothetical protein
MTPPDDSRIASVVEKYLAEIQGGHAPDRAEFLAAHPDLAPQLEG